MTRTLQKYVVSPRNHTAMVVGLSILLLFAPGSSYGNDYSGLFNHSQRYDQPGENPRTGLRMPGHLVPVGQHRLHIVCRGSGLPTVIIDTGLGSSLLEWQHIQRALAKRVTVCLYDRAGYGWSEPGPLPRTSERIVTELHALLTNAHLEGPFVLVGHSFGGYNMQLFASHYPGLTAGVVLVDSSHPQQYERFLAPPIGVKTAPSSSRPGARMFRFTTPKLQPNLPEPVRAAVRSLLLHRQMRLAIANEFMDFRESAAEVLHAGPLPSVPLLILSRGKRVYAHDRRGDLMEALWTQLQTELAARSGQSAHVVAENSGHYIHLDQPQLVIDSIALVSDVTRFRVAVQHRLMALVPALRPAWYAFADANWKSDSLHTRLGLGPLYTSQNGHQQLGRVTDPLMLAWHLQ